MGTKPFKEFNIDIFKLKTGKHAYHFDIDPSFFQQFENSLLEKGNLSVDAVLDKSETFIQVDFDINGTIELICDRSLEEFDYPVSLQEKLIFKFGGEEEGEIADGIVVIPFNAMQINLAQYLYELITVAIPMKKLHPKFQEEEDELDEDEFEVLIYSDAEEEEEEETPSESESDEEEIDPRWNALKNLMNKNNK